MCKKFHIKPPSWAVPAAPKETTSPVSEIRNDTLHEGLFFDEPLGFAIYGGDDAAARSRNVPLEMAALTCRLLVALLGNPDCDYVYFAVGRAPNFRSRSQWLDQSVRQGIE
jgi:hypothetical protein